MVESFLTYSVLVSVRRRGEHETSTSKSTSRAFFSSFHLHRLHFTPLVPLAAMAGSLSDYEGSAEMRDCELIMSPVKDVTLAVPVSGDSMSPEFPNGSVVLVKRIDERAFIEWGRTYVLDTVNGVVIKNLIPSEKGEEWVRCMSINEAPQFAPFDVSLQDVRAVYRVVMSLSRK